MSLLVSGMYYTRIDNPQPLRYWRLIISIPEERIRGGKRFARDCIVTADMGRAVSIDEVSIDPQACWARFFERGIPVEPVSVRIEVSYERQESKEMGEKVLAQAPLRPDQLWAHPVRMIERFDHLFAVDTNTKNGVSVTGVVYGRAIKLQIPSKTAAVQPNLELCVEFRGIQGKAENIAWVQVIQAIRRNLTYKPHFQIGLIVDSDLENLDRYNNRELPVYSDFYLPEKMKFIYASSKPAQETYTSTMIAVADREAGGCLTISFERDVMRV